MNINGYEAYFLLVSTNRLILGKRNKFIPAMAHYINNKKNKYVGVRKFPTRIDETNFFYFVHSQNVNLLQEFVREHPDIEMYVEKLREYFKSNK